MVRDEKFFEELNSYDPGRCPHCNVKMRVVTVQLNKKRQKIGSYCYLCHDIHNWVTDRVEK